MENPATWGEAERIVDAEYKRWWRDREDGMCGLSLARRVTDALRNAGLLVPEKPAPLEQLTGREKVHRVVEGYRDMELPSIPVTLCGGVYQENPDGSWSKAEPLGWLEEHNWLARFIFWVRGIEHCNDREGQKRR